MCFIQQNCGYWLIIPMTRIISFFPKNVTPLCIETCNTCSSVFKTSSASLTMVSNFRKYFFFVFVRQLNSSVLKCRIFSQLQLYIQLILFNILIFTV